MTAKEKAIEFKNKFGELSEKVVDEILDNMFSQLFYIDVLNDIIEEKYTVEYWQEVKKEIENL